jgi:hypothetical protein
LKLCNRCDNYFSPKVSYQIYCSETCREESTREKIAERYLVSRRQKRIGKDRRCTGGCNTSLSIYNDSGFCANCNINQKEVNKVLKELKGLIEYEQE